ncbi:glycosyltransferase [Flavobacteriaceae bacterium AU392]|nr:glycosyltransferase [Flavobacteriaceae bacterium]RKM82837.1 glycosyltransferase [Flavobacteriaceae bacterium AU392]
MKKNLLYIGNKLVSKGKTITTIEVLSELLEKDDYIITTVSNKSNKILRLLDMLFTIFKHRKIVDYVLIDTYSTQNFYYAVLCSLLCKKLNLKYIPILHGGNLPNRLKNNRKLSDLIFKNAHINVAPSLYTKSIFEKKGYVNVKSIPNTIEIDNYKFIEREIQPIKLLWVRSFSDIYNPILAIKVVERLKVLGEKVSLCMIGPDNDGSLTKTINLARKLDVDVEFTGGLTKKEWIEKSKQYNVFINTTNFDNMPVSVIEAMALGLPVVTTNVGGIPYLISNEINGILVNKNNVTEMANAILKLKNNKRVTKNITKKARARVEQFDWNKAKLLWNELLK